MKWLCNDIGRQATFAFAESADTGFAWENLFYGGSNLIGGTTGTSSGWLNFDLGAGNSDTIDFIAIRGAAILLASASTITVDVEGSNDNFSTSTAIFTKALDRGDLVGSVSDDWIEFFTESAAFRFFRVRFYSGSSHFHGVRKLYLGKAFNFDGIAPKYPYNLNLMNAAGDIFATRSGSAFSSSSGKSFNTLQGGYHGISDAARDVFVEKVVRHCADYPLWVYTESDFGHAILRDTRALFCWARFETLSGEQWRNNNSINFMLREDVI
jgi:hypothetical protein